MDERKVPQRTLLITGSQQFFAEVSRLCESLLPDYSIEQQAADSASSGDRSRVRLIISETEQDAGRQDIPHDDFVRSAFAFLRDSGQTQKQTFSPVSESVISRNELILRLHAVAAESEQGTLVEETILESDWLRVSRLECSTRVALMPTLRNRLLEGISTFRLANEVRLHQFCMALEECLANSFYHGNLEVPSELKEAGDSAFMKLARSRQSEQPWMGRLVRVTEVCGVFGLWLTIEDEGAGFHVEEAIRRAENPESLLSSGRGLLMMRAFADEVFFNERGNRVTLVLYPEKSAGINPGAAGSFLHYIRDKSQHSK
ncbi:MAG: ATP-binding protein [Planctomycetaceae bacterium]|nr:ATP-binding protein [Planctomycetaceae bacterium]